MRRGTKVFLLAGCALVLFLELPATLALLAADLRGPYPARAVRMASARALAPPSLASPSLASMVARR